LSRSPGEVIEQHKKLERGDKGKRREGLKKKVLR